MKGLRIIACFCIAAVLPVVSACRHEVPLQTPPEIINPVVDVSSDPAEPFLAGFAKEVITPRGPVWIAGFGFLRLSFGVHDDIFARSLVLKQGDEKLALVSMDLIGVQRDDVEKIKSKVQGFRPDQVIIACTHVHSGPDTMGLWGFPPLFSGKNEKYMQDIGDAVARAIERAEGAAVPVGVWTAVYGMNPDIMYNANEGEPKDDTMGIMVFRDQSEAVVATLINVAGHPEIMWDTNHIITADYPGVVYRLVERKYGGGAVFFNGALGSMITPELPGPEEFHTWSDVEKTGGMVADDVGRGMERLVREERPSIIHRASLIRIPMVNDNFKLLGEYGIVKRDVFEGETIITQVNVIEIGSAQFVTFPGEAYPKQGMNIRAAQKPNSFQIGLADDELGYILYPDDYGTELYKYETSMCVGPELAVEMEKALLELMEE